MGGEGRRDREKRSVKEVGEKRAPVGVREEGRGGML